MLENTEKTKLIDGWWQVNKEITKSVDTHDRKLDSVRLIAVSKTKPVEMVWTLANEGQVDFAENYLQEAVEKIAQTSEQTNFNLTWHYIGHIQRNKTRDIAQNFLWVHTVDRFIIAERLNNQRDDNLPKLNVLLQVNIDAEESKSGCTVSEVHELVKQIIPLSRISLRGLMIIPTKQSTQQSKEDSAFYRTQRLFQKIQNDFPELTKWDTISMGMSADVDTAIEFGSTMVRVGTAIFGGRG